MTTKRTTVALALARGASPRGPARDGAAWRRAFGGGGHPGGGGIRGRRTRRATRGGGGYRGGAAAGPPPPGRHGRLLLRYHGVVLRHGGHYPYYGGHYTAILLPTATVPIATATSCAFGLSLRLAVLLLGMVALRRGWLLQLRLLRSLLRLRLVRRPLLRLSLQQLGSSAGSRRRTRLRLRPHLQRRPPRRPRPRQRPGAARGEAGRCLGVRGRRLLRKRRRDEVPHVARRTPHDRAVRPGYEIARREVDVVRGETSDVLVELQRP